MAGGGQGPSGLCTRNARILPEHAGSPLRPACSGDVATRNAELLAYRTRLAEDKGQVPRPSNGETRGRTSASAVDGADTSMRWEPVLDVGNPGERYVT
jgi:hypothetical protein